MLNNSTATEEMKCSGKFSLVSELNKTRGSWCLRNYKEKPLNLKCFAGPEIAFFNDGFGPCCWPLLNNLEGKVFRQS